MRRLILTAAALCLLGNGSLATAQVPIKPTDPLPVEPRSGESAAPAGPANARRSANTPDFHVRYTGELIDADSKPLSGVMGLTFRLYEEEGSTTPIWSERLFVAVDLGVYTVDLGAQTPFPRELSGQRRWLSVSLETLGELLREPIVLRPFTAPPKSTPARIQQLSFAELADRAVMADHARIAEDAERLGGKTLAEIDRYPELYRQFMELRSQLHAIRNSGGTRVARRTTTTEIVGGPGGATYRITCPEGQVVVGITGRAGSVVDGLGVICAPLEQIQ